MYSSSQWCKIQGEIFDELSNLFLIAVIKYSLKMNSVQCIQHSYFFVAQLAMLINFKFYFLNTLAIIRT